MHYGTAAGPQAALLLSFPQIDLTLVRLQSVLIGLGVVAQDQLGTVHVEALGGSEFDFLLAEGADHQDLLILVFHGVHIELIRQGEVLLVNTVSDTGQALAQLHGLAVEVENGIGIGFLLGCVQPGVILVDADPGGLGGGEAGVLFIRPLHRCSALHWTGVRALSRAERH